MKNIIFVLAICFSVLTSCKLKPASKNACIKGVLYVYDNGVLVKTDKECIEVDQK